MKVKNLKYITGIILISLFLFSSCTDILDEQPRSIFEPSYFKTEKGVLGGLTSLYADLRYPFGNGYFYNACLTGTDEYTWAQSADENFRVMDFTSAGVLTPTNSRADVLWYRAFVSINTANAIIENGAAAGVSEALIAEAKFFRAFNYFMLVQTFGGVPLDLGSGELKFNSTPMRKSVRNTVPEVYTRCIFPDLIYAIDKLPENPRLKGTVTKNVARLYLAKAYLTYGWWLENPKDIPTYPECDRVDPDGKNPQWYFQRAYDIAIEAIDNPGPYGLMPTYYDVNLAQNDRNKEHMLWADHTQASEKYNEGSLTYGSGGSPDNFAVWMVTWNYTNIRSSIDTLWIDSQHKFNNDPNGEQLATSFMSSVQREAAQAYGRPWTRMAPPIGVFKKTFADKIHDSRYDGTFVTTFRGNWNKSASATERARTVLYNANNLTVKPGDAILTFLSYDPAPDSVTYVVYNSALKTQPQPNCSRVGAAYMPGRADYVIPVSGISRLRYPNLWKLGTYRTDHDVNTSLGQPNAGLTRPFYIAKFSEFYFIAAEAAVKGAQTQPGKTARDLILVIRKRAGKWRWDNNGNKPKIEDHSAEMEAATPTEITIDYILEERSREYFGEGYRWYDLVRTQKWEEFAGEYEICGTGEGDHTPQKFTRNIQKGHYLRPIPQGQIDALEMTTEEKTLYQNPAYRQ